MDGSAPATYRDALKLLDRRIEREILRLRARYQLSLDEFRGLYISDEQVDRLVGESNGGSLPDDGNAIDFIMSHTHLETRWARLVSAFGLSALEQDIVLLALAPEIDLRYETLYAYLNNDVGRKWPTQDLARRLLVSTASSQDAVASALAPEGRLASSGVIENIDPPLAKPSRLNAGFALQPSVARFLVGAAGWRTQPNAPEIDANDSMGSHCFSADFIDRLRGIARLLAGPCHDAPVVVLLGEYGTGRALAAQVIGKTLEIPLRMFDLATVRRTGATTAAAVRAISLESRLDSAMLCVTGIEALCDHEGHLSADARGLLSELDRTDIPLVIAASKALPWRELLGNRRTLVLELNTPDFDQRLKLWRHALLTTGVDAPGELCAALADRFCFEPAQILSAARTARDWARCDLTANTVDSSLLFSSARAQSHDRLKGLASKVSSNHVWDDLVLPAAAAERLRDLCGAIQHRHVVYSDWGFAQRSAAGTGVKALFAGASGTGKTMAAGVIARELELDLYRIDLSGVISKYIGETEKNLDRIFDAASGANAMLFFDEADAVFGKRSEVKDAHDRYANIEVSYLLQKLEQHDGVVILASNFKRNIDDAFARRLHYVVDFPKPDSAQREQLWRAMFPSKAPLDDDIDIPFLGRQFELAGGDIRNVALDAAFLAARVRQPIGMRHIVQALARQLGKQGKTLARSDFERYFAFVEHSIVEENA